MDSQHFLLSMVGFTDAERHLLSSTFRLSGRRSFSYLDVAQQPPEQTQPFQPIQQAQRPDIYLIDADNPRALAQLQASASARGRLIAPNQHAPAVIVGRDMQAFDWPFIKKPIHWIKLFDEMDGMMRSALRQRLQRAISRQVEQTPAPAWNGQTFRRQTDLHLRQLEQSINQDADNETVLVVDDSATVRAFMRLKLAAFHMNVEYAQNGEQALRMARAKKYRCIFLDIMMPGIDGYEVCQQLRQHPLARQSAIVMLTSKTSMIDKFRGSWSGCDAYLGKPVSDQDLLAIVKRFLPNTRRVDSKNLSYISSRAS